MDRLFRIDFYPHDWITDTSKMEMDERSIFIQIVALIYCQRGAIDNDPQWIAGLSKCSARLARKVIASLIEKNYLELNSSGKITQKRAESELKSKRNHLETSSNGGRKSAEKRAETNENKDMISSGDDVPVSTSYPTPPPSPIESSGVVGADTPDNTPAFRRIYDAGCDLFPQLATRHTEIINRWIAEGADVDRDVLPVIKNAAGVDVRKWEFFTHNIVNAIATRTKPLPEGKAHATHNPRKSATDAHFDGFAQAARLGQGKRTDW